MHAFLIGNFLPIPVMAAFYKSSINCISICNLRNPLTAQLRCRSTTTKEPPRRIVVTGVGVISPVGCNSTTAWTNICAGHCGVTRLTDSAYASLPCKIAATIPVSDLKLEDHFTKSELRAMAPATAYALIAGNILNIE